MYLRSFNPQSVIIWNGSKTRAQISSGREETKFAPFKPYITSMLRILDDFTSEIEQYTWQRRARKFQFSDIIYLKIELFIYAFLINTLQKQNNISKDMLNYFLYNS